MCLVLLALVSLSIPFSVTSLSQISWPYNLTSPGNIREEIKGRGFLDITGLDLEKVPSKAEELTSIQSVLAKTTSSNTRKALAKVAFHWATVARSAISSQYSEVIHWTRKAQEAQLHNLMSQSIANLIQDAVMKASQVHNNAVERYQDLSVLANSAENNLKSTIKTLELLEQIQRVQDKRAKGERERAFRLSFHHLQIALVELRVAVEFARKVHLVALGTTATTGSPAPYS